MLLRPTAVAVVPKGDYIIRVSFDNGEVRNFDVKPYIKGEWFSQLKDVAYFNAVTTDGYTVTWPQGQDICPDELYAFSAGECEGLGGMRNKE